MAKLVILNHDNTIKETKEGNCGTFGTFLIHSIDVKGFVVDDNIISVAKNISFSLCDEIISNLNTKEWA